MGRPRAGLLRRRARPLCGGVAIALAALATALSAPGAAAAGVEHTDPAGDVFRDLTTPVHEPRVDILLVAGDRTDDALHLHMTVNGTLPVAGQTDAGADRTYRYLFPVIFDMQQGESLLQDHDMSVLCKALEGEDLRCSTPQEGHTFRSVLPSAHGFNVTVALAPGTPEGALEVGGGATMTTENGTEVQAQDFTANAVPHGQDPGDGSTGGETPTADRPWWRTPWILLVAAVAGAAGAVLWNHYRRP